MVFRNQFATATLPARLTLRRSADVVEVAAILARHFEVIEQRAGVVAPVALREAYGAYRHMFASLAEVAEGIAALADYAREEGDAFGYDLQRVEGVIGGAVDMLVTFQRARPGAAFHHIAAGNKTLSALVALVVRPAVATAAAILFQAFAQCSRDAEVVEFPSGALRGGNDG